MGRGDTKASAALRLRRLGAAVVAAVAVVEVAMLEGEPIAVLGDGSVKCGSVGVGSTLGVVASDDSGVNAVRFVSTHVAFPRVSGEGIAWKVMAMVQGPRRNLARRRRLEARSIRRRGLVHTGRRGRGARRRMRWEKVVEQDGGCEVQVLLTWR